MNVISNELLSEVFDDNVFNFCTEKNTVNIQIDRENDRYQEINIYELAHKCKEWAMDKYGCTIGSSIYKEYSKCWAIAFDESFVAPTEPEAIFQACQWIYNNRRNNEQGEE
jgi:hypothetical protein